MLVPTHLFLAVPSMATVICIDPGHPSEVGVGTRGIKVTEVGVCWSVAKDLKARLEEDGYTVVMTKSAELEKVLNHDRAATANKSRAALMVRLHCDASSSSGFQVFVPTHPGTAEGVTGPSKRVIDQSVRYATAFHAAMAQSLKGELRNLGLASDDKTAVGSKQGALTGSVFSEVPVLLVEMVVLTNRKDEVFIFSRSGHRAMVEALAAGVRAAVPPR